MADEAEVVVGEEEVVVAAPVVDESDAEFDAGFSGETPEPTEVTPPVKVDESGAPVVEAPAAAPVVEPKFVQITEEELTVLRGHSTQIEQVRAEAKKAVDTVNGKYGDLVRRINEIQSAAPAGFQVEVTDEIVADLNAEFPELGKLTKGVLTKFAAAVKAKAPVAAPFDKSQVVPLIDTAKQELSREVLSMKHEDWEEVVGLPDATGKTPETDYRKWLAKQPAEYQQEISSTWNPRALAKSIDKFKSDAAAATKAAAEAAAAAALKAKGAPKPALSARQQRVAAAVTPRGDGGHAPGPTADDEFDAGFKTG